MELAVIFLVSCVITARYLDNKKMQAASVLYSILFILVFTFSLFAVDFDIVKGSMIRLFGAELYDELRRSVLIILNANCLGVSTTTIFVAACITQTVLVVIGLTRCVVSYLIIKKSTLRGFYKAYVRFVLLVRNLCLPRRINLLYCRMLN